MIKTTPTPTPAAAGGILLTREESLALLELVLEDVETDIIGAIRTNAGNDRTGLLAQLDVLQKMKDRINARCQYANPTGRG